MELCGYLIIFFVAAFLLTPSTLQGNGVYGDKWIEDKSCSALDYKPSCCKRTNYSCSGPFQLDELDYTANKFHMAAFWILLTPILCILLEIFCTDENDDDSSTGVFALLGGFCFLFYPIAGLLSFIGCMIIAGKYPGHTFGESFNNCLASGLLVLIITGILCFVAYMKNRSNRNAVADSPEGSDVESYGTPSTAAPYGNTQFPMTTATTTVEQTTVVHGSGHGGFYQFMVRVNIIHTVLH